MMVQFQNEFQLLDIVQLQAHPGAFTAILSRTVDSCFHLKIMKVMLRSIAYHQCSRMSS